MSTSEKFRILMADDVVRYHLIYEAAITDAIPATVEFAADGEQALATLAEHPAYDLLILDLNMPNLPGEETLKKLRADSAFDRMPIVILTGESDPRLQGKLLQLGADDFIEKGGPPEMFVARLKAQLRYKMALDRLAKMAVDMDIFAAGVLHDIRSLEMSIISICELTKVNVEAGATDEAIKDLKSLQQKSVSLGEYASDIIQMVRETQKKVALSPQSIAGIVDWVLPLLIDPDSKESPITCTLGPERLDVLADASFLKLAILNIMQNSIKYACADVNPHVDISQRTEQDPMGRQLVVTCLRDNGIGIKKEDLRSVFAPFSRTATGRKQAEGFGLGLSLVDKVIRMMGGQIWAETNSAGPGTTFCIQLLAAENT